MAQFREGKGGAIFARHNGLPVATVSVQTLTTEEAARVVKAIIAGLIAEFDSPNTLTGSDDVPDRGRIR